MIKQYKKKEYEDDLSEALDEELDEIEEEPEEKSINETDDEELTFDNIESASDDAEEEK
jgi:hypothetical protein